jgi:NAD(P)-dependent dehydrogenase (short-subunit alcohol dehydrogenase family)
VNGRPDPRSGEDGSLAGRRGLVTGAGTGIGLAVATALAEAGVSTIYHYNTKRGTLDDELDRLTRAGRTVAAIPGDLSVPGAVADVVDEAVRRLGGLDILVNNAGLTRTLRVEDETPDGFSRLIWINLGSALFGIQRALEHLERSAHASVINVTSIHAIGGAAGHSAYAASKAALVGLTRQLAVELASRRIRVNAVGPGMVEVPRYSTMRGYTRALGNSLIPLGRVGSPPDVANAVLFLASDSSSWITGQTLWVDGGTTARMPLELPDQG